MVFPGHARDQAAHLARDVLAPVNGADFNGSVLVGRDGGWCIGDRAGARRGRGMISRDGRRGVGDTPAGWVRVIGGGRIRSWVRVIRSGGIRNWVQVIRSGGIRSDWGIECDGRQWVGGDDCRRCDALDRVLSALRLHLAAETWPASTMERREQISPRMVLIASTDALLASRRARKVGWASMSFTVKVPVVGAVASSDDVVGQLFEVSSGVRVLVLGVGDVALDARGHCAYIGIEAFNAFVQVVSQLMSYEERSCTPAAAASLLPDGAVLRAVVPLGVGPGGSTGWFFALGGRGGGGGGIEQRVDERVGGHSLLTAQHGRKGRVGLARHGARGGGDGGWHIALSFRHSRGRMGNGTWYGGDGVNDGQKLGVHEGGFLVG
ncbi:hypothetical protein B0H14DRAFT_2632424 [Mycena olivaceomarginata]|nr:hypothetical protein B0H14DRAFT_2632424 [Mycena olivaceomarginata]